MKFNIKSSDFLKAINSVEGVINSKQIKSVLSNVKIEASDNSVSLSATDMEISVRTSLAADVSVSGVTSLPAKQLSSIFKTINFSDAKLEINTDSENPETVITDAEGKVGSKFQINGLDPEEIRTIGKIEEKNITDFPCLILKEMIRKTNYAVAQEETRFVFNGLFMKCIDDELIVVGTDGRRLSKITRKIPKKLDFGNGIIVPHKTVRESIKLLDQAENGKIGLSESQFYLSVAHSELLSKLIDGSYPDYEQVIPKNNSYSVRINKDEFAIVLRQALISAEEPSRQIRLSFKTNTLVITSSNPGSMQFENSMPIEFSGDDLTIAFKGDYLSDTIKSIDDPEFEIHFTNSSLPVLFKDPSDADYVSVIMPMKI
ncbi:DNA polymerase III subunit beta [Leptospira sp. GIMC2001]|uniref:DNA polymerase III subunit beta n=1 Tax=Leptospira sp. GIMC2001 TaxID=1513297 RepID=UPI0004A5C2BE|nr:DNA polymerase III subunit beta [Leptospira sp. GIMC2001]AID56275.1 DNA polymerase III beta subunit [Leptospira sp. GIMC2001]WCL49522.1 DNA polymerase III subunit beta [Leptospira sp. GIMC2001]